METTLTTAELEVPTSPAEARHARWAANCADLVQFWEENGAFPSRYRQGRERQLYQWLSNQRRRHQLGKLNHEQTKALDAVDNWLTGSFTSREEWQERLKDFVDRHGRKPSICAESEDEKALSRAMRRHRLDVPSGSVDTSLRAIRNREAWEANLDALSQWVEASGRMPKMRAPDPGESRLANFVNVQRRRLAAGEVSADMEAKLRKVPGVLEARPKDRPASEWETMLDTFVSEHGRIPVHGAEDPHERSLAAARYRHRIGIDERNTRPTWDDQLNRVAGWIGAGGSKPRSTRADPEERSLSNWLHRQREVHRKGLLPAGRVEAFRRALPSLCEWLDS